MINIVTERPYFEVAPFVDEQWQWAVFKKPIEGESDEGVGIKQTKMGFRVCVCETKEFAEFIAKALDHYELTGDCR